MVLSWRSGECPTPYFSGLGFPFVFQNSRPGMSDLDISSHSLHFRRWKVRLLKKALRELAWISSGSAYRRCVPYKCRTHQAHADAKKAEHLHRYGLIQLTEPYLARFCCVAYTGEERAVPRWPDSYLDNPPDSKFVLLNFVSDVFHMVGAELGLFFVREEWRDA